MSYSRYKIDKGSNDCILKHVSVLLVTGITLWERTKMHHITQHLQVAVLKIILTYFSHWFYANYKHLPWKVSILFKMPRKCNLKKEIGIIVLECFFTNVSKQFKLMPVMYYSNSMILTIKYLLSLIK